MNFSHFYSCIHSCKGLYVKVSFKRGVLIEDASFLVQKFKEFKGMNMNKTVFIFVIGLLSFNASAESNGERVYNQVCFTCHNQGDL